MDRISPKSLRPLNISQSHQAYKRGIRQPVYVGIELEPLSERPTFCIYVHDGYFGLDYTIKEVSQDHLLDLQEESIDAINADFEANLRVMETQVIQWLDEYADKHHAKIIAAGIGVSYGYQNLCRAGGEVFLCHRVNVVGKLKLPSRLWSELDILPLIVETKGSSSDERACSAVRKALAFIVQGSVGSVARVSVGFRHRVEVDADAKIHFADLDDYQAITDPRIFQQLLEWSQRIKDRQTKVAFFNSTPQGGGVATMRHSIIRFMRLLDIDASWYVARPKPEVFEITKRKMHNVLQGVAPGIVLSTDDKTVYDEWCASNIERDWAKGPMKDSDIIIIDDPQRT